MIQTFIAVDNSSIWDVLNNTYGSIDLIVKLMIDNNFPNINAYPEKGQQFLYDDTLIINQNTIQTNNPNKKFATRNTKATNFDNMIKYEQNFDLNYTSNADGTVSITILALQGQRIVQIEREIMPLKSTDYSFNPTSGTITLLGGLTLDNGQTLFIIYATIVTS